MYLISYSFINIKKVGSGPHTCKQIDDSSQFFFFRSLFFSRTHVLIDLMITKIDEWDTGRKDKNMVLRYFAIFNAKIIIAQLSVEAKQKLTKIYAK